MKKSNPSIESLLEIIERLEARIRELEQRLNKNSSNRSKPSRTSSLRENGKNKSGGQPGHKGETLKQTETPDIIKKHALTTYPDCQHSQRLSPLLGMVKRQVTVKHMDETGFRVAGKTQWLHAASTQTQRDSQINSPLNNDAIICSIFN